MPSAVASVPSGASTGVHEALELRDSDKSRFGGLGVLTARDHVNVEIANAICGREFTQESLDKFLIELDGTPNKSRLGANAILGVSLAFARACAQEKNLELFEYLGSLAGNSDFKIPQPMFNVINGGKHADSGLDIQEFMLAPVGFDNFHHKVQAVSEVIFSLKNILKSKGYAVSLGDEGGFAPKLSSDDEAFGLLVAAIVRAGYSTEDIKIGIDVAASSFFAAKSLTSEKMISWYQDLIAKYPIVSIEDGLTEDDWDGFAALNAALGGQIKIVGDDLTVTNIERIKMAVEKKAVNSVLIKLNQIGTLTETISAILMTKAQGWSPFVSHRSGETTDTFIADLAVGLACDYIKSGSLARGERVCKYNRLLEIEDILNKK